MKYAIDQGHVILSNKYGFYLPADEAELHSYISKLRETQRGIQMRIDALTAAWSADGCG